MELWYRLILLDKKDYKGDNMGRLKKVVEDVEVVEALEVSEHVEDVEVVEELLEEPVQISTGDFFAVFEDDRLIGYARENSSSLARYQESNYNELSDMLERYSVPFDNEKDILFANLGSDANLYQSWAQYQHQTGVAPSVPPIVNLLGYHGKRLNIQDPEEIVVRSHAFKYVFQVIEELD
mgnify:CR=1 FL=1|jgi:hypothetical protein